MDKTIIPWQCSPAEIMAMPDAEYQEHKRNEIKHAAHVVRKQAEQRTLNQIMTKDKK